MQRLSMRLPIYLFTLSLGFLSAQARAEYQYVYTGNPLSAGSYIVVPSGQDDPALYPPAPLAAGDYFSLKISTSQPLQARTYQVGPDFSYELTVGSHTFTGESLTSQSFDVRSLTSAGLPNTWWFEAYGPSHSFKSIFDTFAEDGIMIYNGGYTYYSYNASAQGAWDLAPTVAVPEAETYALFLAGLGLIGLFGSRRRAG